jgi:uracil-DNA glycosylase family 4
MAFHNDRHGVCGLQPLSQSQLKQLIRQRLETLQRAGVHLLPRSSEPILTGKSPEIGSPSLPPDQETVEEQPSAAVPKPLFPDDSAMEGTADPDLRQQPQLSREKRVEVLQQARQEVAACTRCQELASTRTQTVFGAGNPEARLVFLGEAPGADEDRQGEPFVGRAGQLLTKIIESCTFKREDVYILNILKCRPPGNRNPTPEEATNCRSFLLRQLQTIQPEFICCLGAVAAHNLLDTQVPIGRLRGKFHDFRGIRVIATYHPAYLLRNPSAKRHAWDDMKLLMREMGINWQANGASKPRA